MVVLTSIVTKTGDDGKTSLADGKRILKSSPRISLLGGIDELNAHIGLCRAIDLEMTVCAHLEQVQQALFDLGADVATPHEPSDWTPVRFSEAWLLRLEEDLERHHAKLSPLTSFILPGGTLLSAQLHVARTVTRRVERDWVALSACEALPQSAGIYLNRLSDYLFILARCANDDGRNDVLWQPNKKT